MKVEHDNRAQLLNLKQNPNSIDLRGKNKWRTMNKAHIHK